MSKFAYYPLENFLQIEMKPREWLVEGLIREQDSVILVGNEKAGKSLFIFQLICALTSGETFLEKFKVTRPIKVTYIQMEGELTDTQDRWKRMAKTQALDPKLCLYAFQPPQSMQSHKHTQDMIRLISDFHIPDIVIIDPVYFAFEGTLNDDEVIRKFIGELRLLKDAFNCAMILVHHTHKQKFDYAGAIIQEGDEAMFGSKFLKAWADHTLLLDYDRKKNIRILSCNTQRSGDIVKQCMLRLIQPDPLYFEIVEQVKGYSEAIISLLLQPELKEGLSAESIAEALGISISLFYNHTVKPLEKGILIKSETRPVLYRYNFERRRKTN